MADAFRCRVITPEARVLDEDCSSAIVPMHDGQMGFLPGRAPIVGKMGLGELRLRFVKGGERSYLVDDGFLQMVGGTLTVLAGKAIPAETLSVREAEAELAEATARQPKEGDALDAARVRHDRDRARAKVALAKSVSGRGGI